MRCSQCSECQQKDWPAHKKLFGDWYDKYRKCQDGAKHEGQLGLFTWVCKEEDVGFGAWCTYDFCKYIQWAYWLFLQRRLTSRMGRPLLGGIITRRKPRTTRVNAVQKNLHIQTPRMQDSTNTGRIMRQYGQENSWRAVSILAVERWTATTTWLNLAKVQCTELPYQRRWSMGRTGYSFNGYSPRIQSHITESGKLLCSHNFQPAWSSWINGTRYCSFNGILMHQPLVECTYVKFPNHKDSSMQLYIPRRFSREEIWMKPRMKL